MSDPNKALEGAITGVAKEAYSDLIRPSASPIGEALSGIIKALTFYPRFWAKTLEISLDEKVLRFKKALEEKTSQIPIEYRTLPAPNILGPSIQALEYGVIDDEISDLFSNLIASSMDSRIVTHPSFVEIIKQINPEEAKILKYIRKFPSSHYLRIKDGSLGSTIYSAIPENAGCEFIENGSLYLSNIIRLGLLEYSDGFYGSLDRLLEDEDHLHRKTVISIYEKYKNTFGDSIPEKLIYFNVIFTSSLGKSFLNACMPEKESRND